VIISSARFYAKVNSVSFWSEEKERPASPPAPITTYYACIPRGAFQLSISSLVLVIFPNEESTERSKAWKIFEQESEYKFDHYLPHSARS
jgi:hypothetical protein